MAHEIEQHDGVLVHKKQAWHGLATVVEDAPSPVEALKILKMDWEVEPWTLTAHGPDGQSIELDRWVANVRTDIKNPYGVVTTGYDVFQNEELAQFCEALAEQGDQIKVESAGSIRNGAKVWFLLKGESFSVREDEVIPYICVSNGHDGLSALRGTPTTIRVVCSNTLHMVIPDFKSSGEIKNVRQAGFSFRHVGNLKDRVEEAKAKLKIYNKNLKDTRNVIDHIAAKEIKSREDVQRFFLECYTKDFEPIPLEPKNYKEEMVKYNSQLAFIEVANRFDKEQRENKMGANYWTALNAYTGWVQNDRKIRTKDPDVANEQRTHSKLFGADASRAHHALQVAISA